MSMEISSDAIGNQTPRPSGLQRNASTDSVTASRTVLYCTDAKLVLALKGKH
jgi:hypothetical protein